MLNREGVNIRLNREGCSVSIHNTLLIKNTQHAFWENLAQIWMR